MSQKSKVKEFFVRKNVEISVKRYALDALSAMALGLFASLLIGLIIKTIGEQIGIHAGETGFSLFLIKIGAVAMSLVGPAIGVAVAYGLKAPPLVLFASIATGYMGNMAWTEGGAAGGPAGAFVAALIAVEIGKLVSKETKVDIIVTPLATIFVGGVVAKFIGPVIGALMTGLGKVIMNATELQPFWMGIVVAVVVGLVLTAPISSAALCIMLDLSGIAAGAATVGCCAQMVGFAVISFRANGVGGLFAQGIGTSMLQVPNIIKNPWIVLPPTLAAAVLGPVATLGFRMTNIPAGAGMGTSGLVGQIGTFTSMGFTLDTLWKVVILHIVLTAALSYVFCLILKRLGRIKDEDFALQL
ncbi:MAG: PTS sugar transporter subunit IIC [Clostridiales Family XIII bacterium]|jgi:uncharacterized membrane protein|nr:PTS sugar transporter subunit IIC [Clostridiales Family XIII bacterium]